MPEIDTDLYRLLTLALPALTFLVLLIAVSQLGRIRRVLEERPVQAAQSGPQSLLSAAAQPEPATTAAAEPAPVAAQTPEPVVGYAPEPAALYTEAAAQPVAAEPAAAQPVAAAAEEPQEQPFERDGRWWFRRGDELLVYEEQTGQWVPAPAQAVAAQPAPAATATATASAPPGADLGVSSAPQADTGSFWRCPQCGAVNGSTATSCRMCFAARP